MLPQQRLLQIAGHISPSSRSCCASAVRAGCGGTDSAGGDAAAALRQFIDTGVQWDAPVPRFEIGSHAAVEYLAEQGFVVFRDALTATDCSTAMSLIWQSLEALGSGIRRDESSTWNNDRWPGQGVTGSGLTGVFGDYGLTHNAGSWFVRTRPGVIAAHAELHGTNDLLASFDGLALTRPWGLNPTHRPSQGLHWDRSWDPENPDFVQYQGFVNLLPTTPATGGNVVLSGMHKCYKQIMQEYYARGGTEPKGPAAHELLRDSPELFRGKALNPHLEAGDLYIWDGRLLHCGTVPPGEGSRDDVLQRAIVLVCMRPRSAATAKALESRRRAYAEGIGAGANPTGVIDVEARKAALLENGRWDNHGKFVRLPPAALTAEEMRLVA